MTLATFRLLDGGAYDSCSYCVWNMQPLVGAVIVDPATKEVVAMAHSDPDHPTRHAVMVCIDSVAKRQEGGAWCSDNERKEQGLCSCWSVYSFDIIVTTL